MELALGEGSLRGPRAEGLRAGGVDACQRQPCLPTLKTRETGPWKFCFLYRIHPEGKLGLED